MKQPDAIHPADLKEIQQYLQMTNKELAREIDYALWPWDKGQQFWGLIHLIEKGMIFVYRKFRSPTVQPKRYPRFYRGKKRVSYYISEMQKAFCGNQKLIKRLDELSSTPEMQVHYLAGRIRNYDVPNYIYASRVPTFAGAVLLLRLGFEQLCTEEAPEADEKPMNAP